MNIKIEFFKIKIQNSNIITHDVNSKMSIKKQNFVSIRTLRCATGNDDGCVKKREWTGTRTPSGIANSVLRNITSDGYCH